MKKLILIFLCLPMIGFGQMTEVEIFKVTTNERDFIYKYQNLIEVIDEVVKFNELGKKRAALMYLLAVENINHYPDFLRELDIERASNEQLIEIKSLLIKNYDSFIKIARLEDENIYLEALDMFDVE